MDIPKELLEKIASKGAAKVGDAFSKLSRTEVGTEVSNVGVFPLLESVSNLKPIGGQAVVVYALVFYPFESAAGDSGVSLLLMTREDALILVDVLNQKEVGTTGVLQDIDISAVKETLNILSNSFLTAMAEEAGMEFKLGVPSLISAKRLQDVLIQHMKGTAAGEKAAIMFEISLLIANYKIRAKLYIIFNEVLGRAIAKKAD